MTRKAIDDLGHACGEPGACDQLKIHHEESVAQAAGAAASAGMVLDAVVVVLGRSPASRAEATEIVRTRVVEVVLAQSNMPDDLTRCGPAARSAATV